MSRYARIKRNLRQRMYDATIIVNRYPEKTAPNRGVIDWTATPTIKATVKGTIQPATTQAQELAGLEVEQGRFSVFCENLNGSVSPSTDRLELASIEYLVLSQNHWASHSELLVERI